MSTIIWKDGIMYSDSRLSSDNLISANGITTPETFGTGDKMFRVGKAIWSYW